MFPLLCSKIKYSVVLHKNNQALSIHCILSITPNRLNVQASDAQPTTELGSKCKNNYELLIFERLIGRYGTHTSCTYCINVRNNIPYR